MNKIMMQVRIYESVSELEITTKTENEKKSGYVQLSRDFNDTKDPGERNIGELMARLMSAYLEWQKDEINRSNQD